MDRLLASPDYAFHHANELEAALMESLAGDGDFLKYLRQAAAEDRPWDQMFREMIAGDETKEPEKHALTFLKKRIGDADQMTNDTSRVFFGVAVNCAQCHDHPLVSDWKQEHYFGFKSFFDRTYQTASKTLAEKFSGEVKFKTTEGTEKNASFMFLTGAKVEEPKREVSKEQRKQEEEQIKKAIKDKDADPPQPEFSPRAELVKLALDEKNSRFFSRNIVNRLWARYFGRGLVHPLDQLHSENPASHPELMAWLTRELVEHGYHLKRLIRGIVLSDAYARESRWTGKGECPVGGPVRDGEAPRDDAQTICLLALHRLGQPGKISAGRETRRLGQDPREPGKRRQRIVETDGISQRAFPGQRERSPLSSATTTACKMIF